MDAFDNTCKVSGALGFILHLSRVVGIAPLRFEKVAVGWRVRFARAANVYGISFVTILCALVLAKLIIEQWWDPKTNEVSGSAHQILYFVCTGLVATLVMTAAYSGRRRMNTMVACLKQTDEINTKLSIVFPKVSSKITKRNWIPPVLALLGGTITCILDFAMSFNTDNIQLSCMQISFVLIYIILLMMQTQFTLIAMTVASTFKRLKDCLKTLLEFMQCGDMIGRAKPSQPLQHSIHHLAKLHNTLCDITGDVEETHGFLLLLLISIYMLYLITVLYSLIDTLITQEKPLTMLEIIDFMWVTSYLSSLQTLIEPAHQTEEVVEKTKTLVTKMKLHTITRNDEVFKVVEQFYKYLTLTTVSYEPLKIFTMNRGLLVTISGAIITYLVIITQI